MTKIEKIKFGFGLAGLALAILIGMSVDSLADIVFNFLGL